MSQRIVSLRQESLTSVLFSETSFTEKSPPQFLAHVPQTVLCVFMHTNAVQARKQKLEKILADKIHTIIGRHFQYLKNVSGKNE